MLCSVPYFSNASGGAIRAYLASEEGEIAALMNDGEERRLLINFVRRALMKWLMNKSFGSMMV